MTHSTYGSIHAVHQDGKQYPMSLAHQNRVFQIQRMKRSAQKWPEKDIHWGRQVISVKSIVTKKISYSTSHINVQFLIHWPRQLNQMGKDYHGKIDALSISNMKFRETAVVTRQILRYLCIKRIEHPHLLSTGQERVRKKTNNYRQH